MRASVTVVYNYLLNFRARVNTAEQNKPISFDSSSLVDNIATKRRLLIASL